MLHPKVQALGIAHCRREDYPRFLEIMEDAHRLPKPWEQWNEGTQRGKRELETLGRVVMLAEIDPKQFPGWCAVRGMKLDAEARKRYAAEFAMRAISKDH